MPRLAAESIEQRSTTVSNPKKPGTGATNKRRKELAAAKYERQTARRAERAARKRRNERIGWTIGALVGVGLIAAVLFWQKSDPGDVAEPSASASAGASASPSASSVDIGCDPAPTPPEQPASWEKAPDMALADGTDYTLTLNTNCGDIVIETAADKAPETVNSMLWLADQGYFDDTLCHRLTTENIYILQCGDPTATGTGGPGYTVPDENVPEAGEANYPAGTVAMAEASGSDAGSQFFIVYEDTTLPADYTIWGQVTEGLDIVKKVAEAGVADGSGNGTPAASIGILSTQVDPALS